jgi:hypothetical protein
VNHSIRITKRQQESESAGVHCNELGLSLEIETLWLLACTAFNFGIRLCGYWPVQRSTLVSDYVATVLYSVQLWYQTMWLLACTAFNFGIRLCGYCAVQRSTLVSDYVPTVLYSVQLWYQTMWLLSCTAFNFGIRLCGYCPVQRSACQSIKSDVQTTACSQ